MLLPLRYRYPIAMGLAAMIVTPFFCVRAAEAEMQLASNDRTVRPAPRAENTAGAERTRPAANGDVREAFDSAQWGQVSGQMVNLRSGPGTQHPIVATLRSGDYLHALAKNGTWVEVDWPDYAAAWVAQEFVNADGTVTGNNVRIRCAGNMNAAILGETKKGDKLTVLGTAGNWYKVKAPQGSKAYIYNRYVLLGVRAPSNAAAPVPQPDPAVETVPPARPEAPAAPAVEVPAEPIAQKTPAAPEEIKIAKTAPITDQLHADALATTPAKPAAELPKMNIVEAPGIHMPNAEEARAKEFNSPPILELIAQETSQVSVVPPVVVSPIIVDEAQPAAPVPAPAPAAQTPAPAAKESSAKTTPKLEAPVAQKAPTPQTPVLPAATPAAQQTEAALPTKSVRPIVAPEDQDLWGDELPPPKRVTLPPGTRRTTEKESSEAHPPAPAQREGGLVMGLLQAVNEAPESIAITALPAEVVDCSTPAAPVETELPAQPFVWKPRVTRTPYLPQPTASAPKALRLLEQTVSQVGPVATESIVEVEGTLEAVSGPIQACAFAVRADDGSLWHLVETNEAAAGALLGARVRVAGRSGGYPNTSGTKVLEVNTVLPVR